MEYGIQLFQHVTTPTTTTTIITIKYCIDDAEKYKFTTQPMRITPVAPFTNMVLL